MTTREFAEAVAGLYPELGGETPALDRYAHSIVLRVLNDGDPAVQEAMVDRYGIAQVREIARARVHRLTNPAYRRWAPRLDLPPRPPVVERIQALWQR